MKSAKEICQRKERDFVVIDVDLLVKEIRENQEKQQGTDRAKLDLTSADIYENICANTE